MSDLRDDEPDDGWRPHYQPPAWYTGPLPEDGPDGSAPDHAGGTGFDDDEPDDGWRPHYQPPAWYTSPLPEDDPDSPQQPETQWEEQPSARERDPSSKRQLGRS